MKTFANAFLITLAVACLTWLAYQGFPLLLSSEPETISEAEQVDDEPNPRLPVFDPCAPRMHRN
jgi:hypothetical protein